MSKRHCLQEVIVNHKTGFIKRKNYLFKEVGAKKNNTSSFKEACWNNFLPNMLPELFQEFSKVSVLHTWQIRSNQNILLLEMVDSPASLDFEKSIDPNNFLELYNLN